jgi:hypothetical protein
MLTWLVRTDRDRFDFYCGDEKTGTHFYRAPPIFSKARSRNMPKRPAIATNIAGYFFFW